MYILRSRFVLSILVFSLAACSLIADSGALVRCFENVVKLDEAKASCELLSIPDGYDLDTYVSPDGTKLAYVAVGQKDVLWGLIDVANGKKIIGERIILQDKQGDLPTTLVPLRFLWSPDSSEFYIGVGYGAQFSFRKWIQYTDLPAFEKLRRQTQASNPNDGKTGRATPSDWLPVWSLAGKKYRNAFEAQKAGVTKFLPTVKMPANTNPRNAIVPIGGKGKAKLLMANWTATKAPYDAFLVSGQNCLASLKLPLLPVGHWIFLSGDDKKIRMYRQFLLSPKDDQSVRRTAEIALSAKKIIKAYEAASSKILLITKAAASYRVLGFDNAKVMELLQK